MSEVFDADLGVIRRNRWIMGLAMSPFAAALAAVFAGLTAHLAFFAVVPHLTILGAVLTSLAWAQNPWPWREPVQVRANAGGIRVGKRFIPRSAIRAGYVVPKAGDEATRVLLQRRLALPVEIAVKDAFEGRRLLHALGLDASQSVATFRTMSRIMARPWQTVLVAVAFLPIFTVLVGVMQASSRHSPAMAALALPMFGLVLVAGLALFAMPTKLQVGVDGIVLTWFWRKRFISYADIDLVMPYTSRFGRSRIDGLSLTLKEGELRIPVDQSGLGGLKLRIIEERINEAMDSFRLGGAESDAALVRRGDRGIAEWIVALRSIGAGANAGPRTAPVAPERLWRIVEDPRAEAPARAAAAVALGAEPDETSRARLRAVAEATVAPKLRVAIEAAAAENPDDLEAALAEVEAAEEEHRKRA